MLLTQQGMDGLQESELLEYERREIIGKKKKNRMISRRYFFNDSFLNQFLIYIYFQVKY